MQTSRLIAGIVTVAALAGGATGAVAATSDREAEQEVLSGAAERLGVSAGELRSALVAAEDAQLAAAVKAGELTQEQADRIKEHRRADGTVLRLGPGRHGGFGGHHGGSRLAGGPQLMRDVATALGISAERLFERLHAGEDLGEIAEAEGKSLAAVKSAVRETATKRLDAELKAGRITEAQHADLVEHLGEHLNRLGEAAPFHGRGHHGIPPSGDGGSLDEDAPTNRGALFRPA